MATQTYRGSCHCGDVKFEADIDLTQGASKCNCSICSKTRNWGISIKPDAFRLLSGDDAMTDYWFNTDAVHAPFCKRCGIRVHGWGDIPQVGGKFVSVRLASLDGVAPEVLAAIPVKYCNGRDNDWWHDVTAAEKAYL